MVKSINQVNEKGQKIGKWIHHIEDKYELNRLVDLDEADIYIDNREKRIFPKSIKYYFPLTAHLNYGNTEETAGFLVGEQIYKISGKYILIRLNYGKSGGLLGKRIGKAEWRYYFGYKACIAYYGTTWGTAGKFVGERLKWSDRKTLLILRETYGTVKSTAGKLVGLREKWYNNGRKKSISHYGTTKDTAGKRMGEMIKWYKNGNIHKKINYGLTKGTAEKFVGLYEEWFENGNLCKRCNYINGNRDGVFEEWYNIESQCKPVKRCIWNYTNGKRTGEQIEFYENGQMEYRWNYGKTTKTAEQMVGKQEGWHKNGNPKYVSYYKNNLDDRNGEYSGYTEMETMEWYKNGQKKSKSLYSDGITYFDENNKLIPFGMLVYKKEWPKITSGSLTKRAY